MPEESPPSRRVVDQRVRNGVMSYLELAASFEEQLAYERAAPMVIVANEVINQWTDRADDARPTSENQGSAYTPDEIEAMGSFWDAWDQAADAVPGDCWKVAQAQALDEWKAMAEAAQAALEVFAVRGRLSDEVEEF